MLFRFLGFSQLTFNDQSTNLGTIAETFEIKGDVFVKNNTTKKIFLMRADADKGVKVYSSKKDTKKKRLKKYK